MTSYTPEQVLQDHERLALFHGCFQLGHYSPENEIDRTELTFIDEDIPLLFVGIGHAVASLLYLKHLVSSYTHLDSNTALYSNGVFFLGIDHPHQNSFLNSTCGNTYLNEDERADAHSLRPRLDFLFDVIRSRRGIHMRSGEIRFKEVKVNILVEENIAFSSIYDEIAIAALKNQVPYDIDILAIKPESDIADVRKSIQNIFVRRFTGTVNNLFPTREIYRLLLQQVMSSLQTSKGTCHLSIDDVKAMLDEDGINTHSIISRFSQRHLSFLEEDCPQLTEFFICECSTELFEVLHTRIYNIMIHHGPFCLAYYITYALFLLYDLIDTSNNNEEAQHYAAREVLFSLRDKLSRYMRAINRTCHQLNIIMKFLDKNDQLVPNDLPSQWLFHPQSFIEERETLIERVFKEQDICQQFYEHLANDYIHWGGFDLAHFSITQKVANPLTAHMDIDQSLMHFIEKAFPEVVKDLPRYDDGFLFPDESDEGEEDEPCGY